MSQLRATKPRVLRSLVAVTLAAGLVFSMAGTAVADTKVVKAADGNDFKPKHAYINPGDRIRWRNTDNISHNVKALDALKNWNYFRHLSPGETATRTFNNLGDYKYKCTLHNNMWGIIHVRSG
jgi:plastocyanin